MRRLLVVAIFGTLSAIAVVRWYSWNFDRTLYINEEILDSSREFNVNIDMKLLKDIQPAYEQR